MGLLSVLKERKNRKREEHDLRLKQIDESNFEAMCKYYGVSKEEGRKIVEMNIKNEKYKYHINEPEQRIRKPIKSIDNENVCCPKCGSTQLTANKKGFSLGKALVGGVVLVPIAGVATGMIGKNKIIITCLNCGKQFKPGK